MVALSPYDEARFNELFGNSYRKVFNLAYRLSGQRPEAEDLTQEAFLRAYRAFGTYEGHRPFENWIFRIVTRLYLDSSRARKRRVQTISYDTPLCIDAGEDSVTFETADSAPTPEGRLMNGTVSEDLERSLERLSIEQRDLVWRADVEGVPYRELAASTGAPIGTIRSRLHRAHRLLRRHMDELRAARPGAA